MASEERPGAGPAGSSISSRVDAWIAADPDPATRSELLALVEAGAWEQLAERFAGTLQFGTAGLRAELGAGPLRMNRLVVRQAAAGLLAFLGDEGYRAPLVVIGFDARHNSDVFARDSARVFAAGGATVVCFERPGPTPLLAFAVRHLGAQAGVMVTASHNPPGDNGYKVYLGDGAQIVAPLDEAIAARIARVGLSVPLAPLADPAITELSAEVVEAYLDVVISQLAHGAARGVRVAYTPLHGVGAELVGRAFERAGFEAPVMVAGQSVPDPDFPTTPLPNPEEPGSLDLGLALAREMAADVLLANDPDADRLGVAVPASGDRAGGEGWRVLSGDEIGVMLADHLLRHRPAGPDRLVVTSVVSSRLLRALAAHHGVHYEETLTGFKWIVRPALANPQWRFELGYEEALGYAVGPAVRDKDGIAAALVFAELVGTLAAEGSSVPARLEELARTFGLYATSNWSHRFGWGADGVRAAAVAMARWRDDPPTELGGVSVLRQRDWAGEHRPAGSPPSDILAVDLADGARVVLRPSGTEPKLKIYAEVIEAAPVSRAFGEVTRAAHERLQRLRGDVERLLAVEASSANPRR